MTAKNVFGVIVRVIGLLLIFGGGGTAISLLVERFGGGVSEYAMTLDGGLLVRQDFWVSLVLFAIGVYFLRGAPGLVSFAYPGVSPARGGAGAKARPQSPEHLYKPGT